MFSMEDSVGFQVWNPELLGIVEDTASFDVNCAGSWMEKQSNQSMFSADIADTLSRLQH